MRTLLALILVAASVLATPALTAMSAVNPTPMGLYERVAQSGFVYGRGDQNAWRTSGTNSTRS